MAGLQIDKKYYSVDEVGLILEITAETVLHYGATDRLEIVSIIPNTDKHSWSLLGSYAYKFPNKNGDFSVIKETLEVHDVEFVSVDSYSLFCLETGRNATLPFTTKAYTIREDTWGSCALTPMRFAEICAPFMADGVDIDYCCPWFSINEIKNQEKQMPVKKNNLFVMKHELDRFIQSQKEPTDQPQDKPQRATPISDQHRENLLRQIRANGYNALELPMWKAGKPSIKSEMRELLVPDTMTADVFNKTWERASNDKIIQYKK